VPEGAAAVTPDSMPRLHGALSEVLESFGGSGLALVLDVRGGLEAWLAGSKLVLGAGALSTFGQAELSALVALAVALGEAGEGLRRPGALDGWQRAAVTAFTAYPASLAFLRVLAQLEDGVRGTDPAQVEVGAVLRSSRAFQAVAQAAVERIAGRG
jgi:hypothetical protein